jgi:hypothetical protein
MASEIALAAVEVGLTEAKRGIYETAGENRGPEVDQIQLAANNALAQAWCAKFVWWCFEKAAQSLRTKNPFPKIFLSSALEAWAAREQKVVKMPERGDVFVKSHKHTGLATGPLVSGLFVPAVEGNTWVGAGASKSKEGVWVTSKTQFAACTFIRF